MVKRATVPFAITSLRLLSIPFLLIFLYQGQAVPFLVLFSLALSTDYLDGHLARKLDVTSRSGAYYDSLADFGLVLSILLLFTWQGISPHWVPSIVVISFSIFLITSINKTLIYDPIGKYFGGFLFGAITFMVVLPQLESIIYYAIIFFFVASLASRTAFLFYHSSSGLSSEPSSRAGTIVPNGQCQE